MSKQLNTMMHAKCISSACEVHTMVDARVSLTEYSNRVLAVVKAKHNLKDKSEALNKFIEMCGEEFVEREVSEDVIKEVIDSCNRHIKKHGFRKMSTKELDLLCSGE